MIKKDAKNKQEPQKTAILTWSSTVILNQALNSICMAELMGSPVNWRFLVRMVLVPDFMHQCLNLSSVGNSFIAFFYWPLTNTGMSQVGITYGFDYVRGTNHTHIQQWDQPTRYSGVLCQDIILPWVLSALLEQPLCTQRVAALPRRQHHRSKLSRRMRRSSFSTT